MPDEPLTINYKRGFTLIELLIVIALIGILSSFGVFSYQSSQKKARDSQRKSDLQQVKRAMEAAKNDCLSGSYYPVDTSWITFRETFDFQGTITFLKNYNYISKVLQDSKYDSSTGERPYYGMLRSSSTNNACTGTRNDAGVKDYVLRATLEITNDPESASSFGKCQAIITNLINGSLISSSDPAPFSGDSYYYVCPD